MSEEMKIKAWLDAEMDELYEIALRLQLLHAMHKDVISEPEGQFFQGGDR